MEIKDITFSISASGDVTIPGFVTDHDTGELCRITTLASDLFGRQDDYPLRMTFNLGVIPEWVGFYVKGGIHVKYNDEEQQLINDWLISVGAPYLVGEEFFEYKDGQLLEIAKAKADSLLTWDEWQHLQTMMDMEIPLDMSIRFVGVLYENDIEVLELNTGKSKEYEDKYHRKLLETKKNMKML